MLSGRCCFAALRVIHERHAEVLSLYIPLDIPNPPSRGISLCTTCDLSSKRHHNSAACARLTIF
jgi:hypothetical protein